MYCLSMDQKTTILRALVEGNSIRSIERMTGDHRDTILSLLVSVGEQARFVMNTVIRNVAVNRLHVDELWTFVRKKDKRAKRHDPHEFGSQYVFAAIDADTKRVPRLLSASEATRPPVSL